MGAADLHQCPGCRDTATKLVSLDKELQMGNLCLSLTALRHFRSCDASSDAIQFWIATPSFEEAQLYEAIGMQEQVMVWTLLLSKAVELRCENFGWGGFTC